MPQQVFRDVKDFKGEWFLRNRRRITITENPKKLLLELNCFPMILVPYVWNLESGKSLIDEGLDLVERVKDVQGLSTLPSPDELKQEIRQEAIATV